MTRPIALAALVLLGAQGVSFAPALTQEPAPDQQESELDKLVRVARTGRPAFRPQAARRLVDRGAPAAARLLQECGETNRDLAALGTALVEVLAEFDEPRLRAKAWTAVADTDFPWRPAAARGLAVRPEVDEAARFAQLSRDAIAPVRHAAILGLRALATHVSAEDFDAAAPLRDRLSDPDDRVRRAAAAGLADMGQASALWWIAADLERDDRFFDRPDGRIARYDAARELEERLGTLHGFDPEKPPAANAEALAAIGASLRELAGERPELPPVARPSTDRIESVLGLELRSCRHGEVFLRWDASDVLWIGTGNPARVQLPQGTTRALAQAANEDLATLGERRFWGEAGCDIEQIHFRPASDDPVTTLVLAKGPDAIEGLRPEALTRLVKRMAMSLPQGADPDPRVAELSRRTRATLAALGGPLE